MKKMKSLTIIWVIIMFLVFGLLTTYGLLWTKKLTPYKELESKIEKALEQYGEIKFIYNDIKGEKKVNIEELEANNLIKDIKVGNDKCEAYGIIKKDNLVWSYKGYIKCSKYQTKGFRK